MPYLNWKAPHPSYRQHVVPLAQGCELMKMSLSLSMEAAQAQELSAALQDVLGSGVPAGELRLDLPGNWIVFWKVREGEGRLLIAHPEKEEWVTTVALSAAVGLELLRQLESWSAGQSIALGRLGPFGSVSNADVTLIHL